MFTTGASWAAFARLIDPLKDILEEEYGKETGWPDAIRHFFRACWRGEHDSELAALSVALSVALDDRTLRARIKENFKSLNRKMSELLLQSENRTIKLAKKVEPAVPLIAAIDDQVGDVTSSLEPPGKKLTAPEKLAMVAKLNKDAIASRDKAILDTLQRLAAETFRSRVATFPNAERCNKYMESGAAGLALTARCVLIDVTMPKSRQTGGASRQICLAPNKELQRSLADATKTLPCSAVVGHVLIRPALHSIEELTAKLKVTHSHVRHITVPIAVPESVARAIRSAASRSMGPSDAEASELDFIMRTIGRSHAYKRRRGKGIDDDNDAEADLDGADDDANEDEDEDLDPNEEGDRSDPRGPESKNRLAAMDPATMSMKELEVQYGTDAGEIAEVFFQHSSRIAPPAKYLTKQDALFVKSSERAEPKHYRKGQVHPSAFYSAFVSALSTTPSVLHQHEALVILTGGTPDAVTAGIAAGFGKILYVSDDPSELDMMQLPEDISGVNFSECPGLRFVVLFWLWGVWPHLHLMSLCPPPPSAFSQVREPRHGEPEWRHSCG